MTGRAFPVVYSRRVAQTTHFYESLGFEAHVRLPPTGPAGYIGLRRGASELAVTSTDSPEQLAGVTVGDGVGSGARFEMFVYVDDVDATVARLRGDGAVVLREPADMFWGERVGYVTDPDGNPVALASTAVPD